MHLAALEAHQKAILMRLPRATARMLLCWDALEAHQKAMMHLPAQHIALMHLPRATARMLLCWAALEAHQQQQATMHLPRAARCAPQQQQAMMHSMFFLQALIHELPWAPEEREWLVDSLRCINVCGDDTVATTPQRHTKGYYRTRTQTLQEELQRSHQNVATTTTMMETTTMTMLAMATMIATKVMLMAPRWR